jgi:hypothetical protein
MASTAQANGIPANNTYWDFFDWAICDGTGLTVNDVPAIEQLSIHEEAARCARFLIMGLARWMNFFSYAGVAVGDSTGFPAVMHTTPTLVTQTWDQYNSQGNYASCGRHAFRTYCVTYLDSWGYLYWTGYADARVL